jgi:ribosome-interacting GTPase 1
MNSHERFTNWLEGLLDACKNKPTPQHVKDIRKKLESLKSEERANEVLRNQSSLPFSTFSLTKEVGDEPEKFLEDDFQTAIEKSKNASTMEELFKS